MANSPSFKTSSKGRGTAEIVVPMMLQVDWNELSVLKRYGGSGEERREEVERGVGYEMV